MKKIIVFSFWRSRLKKREGLKEKGEKSSSKEEKKSAVSLKKLVFLLHSPVPFEIMKRGG